MLFKFMGFIPAGRIEFTCICSAWNSVDYITNECTVDDPLVVTCTGCQQKIRIWQQDTHWHMDIDERREPDCNCELISIKNEKIDSGFMCVKCNRVFQEYNGPPIETI